MGDLVSIALTLYLCLSRGLFSETIALAFLVFLIGKWSKRLSRFSLFLFIGTLACSFMVCQESGGFVWAPGLAFWALRSILSSRPSDQKRPAAWLVLPALVVVSGVTDRDITASALALLLGLAPTLRLPRFEAALLKRRPVEVSVALTVFLAIPGVLLFLRAPKTEQEVFLLDEGQWARTERKLTVDEPIDIGSVYSYSEFAALLGAEIMPVEALSSSVGEAWLITPTRPPSPEKVQRLLGWVGAGGDLFIVTDHTDLFGHARVVNEYLRPVGVRTSITAFFPTLPDDEAQASPGGGVWLKTANVQTGAALWPRLTARWVDEDADYSGKNFFGALRPTAADRYGRRTIAASTNLGRGRITLFGDSTVLANFALYQPRNLECLERLRQRGVFPLLHGYAWVLVLLGAVLYRFESRTILRCTPALGLLALLDLHGLRPREVRNQVPFSGNPMSVMEWTNPAKSISTAYAFVPLSGKRPRWYSDISSCEPGIWVSEMAPPDPRWRWVRIGEALGVQEEYDPRLEPFLSKVNGATPLRWPKVLDRGSLSVNGLWTNAVLGDWWADQGISEAKRQRVLAWTAWIQGLDPPANPEPFCTAKQPVQTCQLKLAEREAVTLILPQLDLVEGHQIYFGRGVSGDVVRIEGKLAIYGTRAYTEGWDAPSAWVLCPSSDTLVKPLAE